MAIAMRVLLLYTFLTLCQRSYSFTSPLWTKKVHKSALVLDKKSFRGHCSIDRPSFIDTVTREATRNSIETSQSTTASSKWDSFDYLQHWYPVSWVQDLRKNLPTKVSLFDQDYAVVVNDDGSSTALLDVCPHRGAALSEGRITTSGLIQCSYHGWSFDNTGTCQQIPQAAAGSSSYSPRSCAKAVPAKVHQGMLWLWPGPVKGTLPMPPTIPEMDDPAFKVIPAIRDFPVVDWSLLLSNIMDPDHGLFAHQMDGFDWYSASPDLPMQVEEQFPVNGWTMIARVPAQEKLRSRDRQARGQKLKALPLNITATTTFYAPTVVTIGRRDSQQNTKFLNCFFVCPTGTGKSRFMAASVGKLPFTPPRWVQHMGLNNFLDQDTVLVASQQPVTLSSELESYQSSNDTKAGGARQRKYVYQSPTDKSVRLVDQFWDATLRRVPHRVSTLMKMQQSGALDHIPSRQVILDRKTQHLDICPDSQGVVRNCQYFELSRLLSLALWLASRVSLLSPSPSKRVFWAWPLVSSAVYFVAHKVRKEFYFNYPETKKLRDLAKIPVKTWLDPQ
jgi:phenylpropionate dioxygenase-like ring-hydroxylating dioxygenase large terminal subunit